MDFHCLAGPRNVIVDLKNGVLYFYCLCGIYPLQSGEVNCLNFVFLVGGNASSNPT